MTTQVSHDEKIAWITKSLMQTFSASPEELSNHFYKPLHQNDFNVLERFKYMIAFNMDSTQGFLYLFQYKNEPCCMLIIPGNLSKNTSQSESSNGTKNNSQSESSSKNPSKRTQYRTCSHRFDENLYTGTLLEIELVDKICLISDVLLYMGKDHRQHSVTYKTSLIASIVKNRYHPDQLIDSYRLMAKEFIEYDHLKSFWETHRETLPYSDKINGLLFRPNSGLIKNTTSRKIKNFTVFLSRPHCHKIENLFSQSEKSELIREVKVPQELREINSVPQELSLREIKSVPQELSLREINLLTQKSLATEFKSFFVVPDKRRNKPDSYHLYTNADGSSEIKLTRVDLATVTTLENSLRLQEIFKTRPRQTINNLSGLTLDCQFVKRFKKWEPVV